MNGTIKFLVGLATTALLAIVAHRTLGLGTDFIDELESDAVSAVGNAGGTGVSVAFVRAPALHRVAILAGTANAATRARLLNEVRAIPGVRDARWGAAAAGMSLLLESLLLLLACCAIGVGLGGLLWGRRSA